MSGHSPIVWVVLCPADKCRACTATASTAAAEVLPLFAANHAEIRRLENRVEQLEHEVLVAGNERADARASRSLWRGEYQKLRERADATMAERDRAVERCAYLEARVGELNDKLGTARGELSEARDRSAELTRERDEALATIQAVLDMERTDRGFVRADDPETTRWMMGYDEALDEVGKVIAAARESGRPVAQEAPADGTRRWQVTVRVPMHLPVEVRDRLLGAVADAVSNWEPPDRDGWDADVFGHPETEARGGLPYRYQDRPIQTVHASASPRMARVWQKGDPEPPEDVTHVRHSNSQHFHRETVMGHSRWRSGRAGAALTWTELANRLGVYELTEVFEGGAEPKVPPGPYAKGGRSPIVWVFLCAVCAGFAPLTAEDYVGSLSGQCQGCGSNVRERHRFRAWIDSAAGCSCAGGHPQVVGDVGFEGGDSQGEIAKGGDS